MKRTILCVFAAIMAVSAFAQTDTKMRVWSGNEVIGQKSVSDVDSITFVQTNEEDIWGEKAGTIYTTDVVVKQDIRVGGTVLGNLVAKEDVFPKNENDETYIPAGTTLQSVLEKILYKNEEDKPSVKWYWGVVGGGSIENQIPFTEGYDCTSDVLDHVCEIVDGVDSTPNDAIMAFRSMTEELTSTKSLSVIPAQAFRTSDGALAETLTTPNGPFQFIVLVPKAKFNTVSDIYDCFDVTDSFGANWTTTTEGKWITNCCEVVIRNQSWYMWSIGGNPAAVTSRFKGLIPTGQNFIVTFNNVKPY